MNPDLYLMYTEKNYLKWIINLNIKAKVMNFLEESITIIFVTWHRQRFLGTQKTLTIEEKTYWLTEHNIKKIIIFKRKKKEETW